jgi:choline dehydrogenase
VELLPQMSVTPLGGHARGTEPDFGASALITERTTMASPAPFYDFIVVGAGVAGSVLAARLSERGDARVLVLEAGPSTAPPYSWDPTIWPTLSTTAWNWGESSPVQMGTGTTVAIPRGRGAGGSSLINAMIFMRGHYTNYDAWAENGVKGWSFNDLLPYFKRTETAHCHDPALRGTDGPLAVAPADPLTALQNAGLSAALESGYARAKDISGGTELGFGPVDLNIVNGRRQTAADAYLWPALRRSNVEMVDTAVAHRLIFEGSRCVGVACHVVDENRAMVVRANEVILAAGAIGSPQLLMLSGVGPQSHLREVDIPVHLDLPGVGSNLQDHAWVFVGYRAARPVPAGRNNHGEVTGLIRTGQSQAPDLQLIFGDSADFVGVDGVTNGFAIAVCMVQPFSRGTVRLSPIEHRPIIDPNYFADDRDMQAMIKGIHFARELGMADALKDWGAEEVSPGPELVGDSALRAFVKKNAGSYTHLVGTCAMGDTASAVVDDQLRVRGLDGLRIADASVIPTVPSANTAAPVYAVAERAAEMALQN